MKVINHTHYNTRALRSLILEAIRRDKIEGPLPQLKSVVVTFKYRNHKGTYPRGEAYIRGVEMTIWMPRKEVDVECLAWLIIHEVMHLRGYRHRNLSKRLNYFKHRHRPDWCWAKKYEIDLNGVTVTRRGENEKQNS